MDDGRPTWIRSLRERLRSSWALQSARFIFYSSSYRLWRKITHARPDQLLFLSDSHETFTGNFAALRDELRREAGETRVIGVFKPTLRSRRSAGDIVRLPYLMATSATIVLDDYYPLVYPISLRPETRLVQVWHASGAFKRVGHSRAGLPGGPMPGSRIHRNYTHVTVSSEAVRADYADSFGVDIARVLPVGVPRTDALFDSVWLERARARVRDRLGVTDDERLVCYAPTFRGPGQRGAFAHESADLAEVASQLGGGWRLAVRWHPFTAHLMPPVPVGVLDASGDLDMNEVLAATDVLVTDYSSAIFDFGLLRRPVVFFVPDLAGYEASRSFYRPFGDYAIGPVVEDAWQLADAIRAATVDDLRLDRFLREFCGALDGRSSERIARALVSGFDSGPA